MVETGNFFFILLELTLYCTISGPSDFKLLINDLAFDFTHVKYVDNMIFCDTNVCSLQDSANHLVLWC
jgi:hypothetical protein